MNISNTDISSVVISQMVERYSEYKEMECRWLSNTTSVRRVHDAHALCLRSYRARCHR